MFEEAITQGRAQWVASIDLDEKTLDLTISLTQEPETMKVHRVLQFTEISNPRSDWHDRDDDSTETIIAAEENSSFSRFSYFFHTDQRELTFYSSQKVQINDI